MSDDKKVIRIHPEIPTPPPGPTRMELEREIEVLKSAVLTLTEEVVLHRRTINKIIRGLKK